MSLANIFVNGRYTVVVNNKSLSFDPTHPEYSGPVECVKTGDADEFTRLMETGHQIENWSGGDF